ncbi:MAG: zinc-binding dehydrogenase [Actinobacteria bacterium]|nr:MAG: zinc-binding dehydrogenase [Actinomycetota bacterium]
MRAAVVREVGAVPEVGELPGPTPGDGEALVEVRAAALNPIDIAIASGRFYAGPPHVPYAPGREGVGLVLESGTLAPGTRVRFERDTGYGANGSLAELIVVDEDALVPLPDDAEDTVAAALGIAGLAAWLALGKAELEQGETVLVLGATGAVGQVAVQGAKLLGAGTVVAAARNADALERTRQLGADAVVPLGDGELADAFKSAAGGEVDAVIDPLWGEPAVAALGALRIGGRLVHLGTSAGLEANVPSASLRGKNVRIIGHSNLTTPHDVKTRAFRELLDHVIAGRIRVDVDVFPLERVADAWREQAASPHRKIVVTP